MSMAVPGNRDKMLRTHRSFKEDISSDHSGICEFCGGTELDVCWQSKSMRPFEDT